MTILAAHYFSLANVDPFACETMRQRNYIMGSRLSSCEAYPMGVDCSDVASLADTGIRVANMGTE